MVKKRIAKKRMNRELFAEHLMTRVLSGIAQGLSEDDAIRQAMRLLGIRYNEQLAQSLMAVYRQGVKDAGTNVGVSISFRELDKSMVRKVLYSPAYDMVMRNYNDFAKQQIREVLTKATTEDVLSIREIKDELVQKLGVVERRGYNIARTEMANLYNIALEQQFQRMDPEETRWVYKWVGPEDARTTEICNHLREITKNGVTLSELRRVVRDEATRGKYVVEGFDYDNARPFVPHFQCRHTFVAMRLEGRVAPDIVTYKSWLTPEQLREYEEYEELQYKTVAMDKKYKPYKLTREDKARLTELHQKYGRLVISDITKEKIYLKPGEKAPEAMQEMTGPRGGRYYESGSGSGVGTFKPSGESLSFDNTQNSLTLPYGGIPDGGGWGASTEYEIGAQRIGEACHCILGSLYKIEMDTWRREAYPGVLSEAGHITEEIGIIRDSIDEYSKDMYSGRLFNPESKYGQKTLLNREVVGDYLMRISRELKAIVSSSDEAVVETAEICYDVLYELGRAMKEADPTKGENAFRDNRLRENVQRLIEVVERRIGDNRKELQKAKIYLGEHEHPPEGYQEKRGPRGGRYYESGSGGNLTSLHQKHGWGTRGRDITDGTKVRMKKETIRQISRLKPRAWGLYTSAWFQIRGALELLKSYNDTGEEIFSKGDFVEIILKGIAKKLPAVGVNGRTVILSLSDKSSIDGRKIVQLLESVDINATFDDKQDAIYMDISDCDLSIAKACTIIGNGELEGFSGDNGVKPDVIYAHKTFLANFKKLSPMLQDEVYSIVDSCSWDVDKIVGSQLNFQSDRRGGSISLGVAYEYADIITIMPLAFTYEDSVKRSIHKVVEELMTAVYDIGRGRGIEMLREPIGAAVVEQEGLTKHITQVIAHEIGHHIFFSVIKNYPEREKLWNALVDNGEALLTFYSHQRKRTRGRAHEPFAECYMLYKTVPDYLEAVSPNVYSFFNDLGIREGRRWSS